MTSDERPAGLAQVFVNTHASARGYGHNCQLSKKRRIRVCTDPGHGRDADLLRDALILLGVLPDPDGPSRRSFVGKAIPARGRCPECHTNQALMADGTVRSHKRGKRGGEYCPGRYKPAVVAPVAVAS
jgi:hypothetical protein